MKIFHLIADSQDMGLIVCKGSEFIYLSKANMGITRSLITVKRMGWLMFPVATFDYEMPNL